MELHIPTLALVAVFVTVILGAIAAARLAARPEHRRARLVGRRLSASAAASFALLAARGVIPDVLSIEIANTLLLVGYGFLFAGTRAFGGRETPVTALLVAPLIWLIAMQVPAVADDINLRVVIVTSLPVRASSA